MSFSGSYTLLFEATILHGYFLNDGETAFNAMEDEGKIKMLSKYKHDSFIEVKSRNSIWNIEKPQIII